MRNFARRRLRLLAPLLAAVLALGIVAWVLLTDHKAHELRWTFQPGQVLLYRTVAVMGAPGEKDCHITLARYTIGNVSSDGIAELSSAIERTIIRKDGPEGPLIWDSASGEPPPADWGIAFAAAATDAVDRMKVDRRGRVLSREADKTARERLRGTAADNMFGEAILDVAESDSGGSFLGPPLPAAAVKRGERWSSKSQSGTQTWGRTTFVDHYALGEVAAGTAVINLVRRDITQTPGDMQKALKMEKPPPDPNEDRGNEETVRFSIREGRLLSKKTRAWTQSTSARGTITRFELLSETTFESATPP